MLSSLYIGATGMKSLSEGMHVTGNNLANVSTVGFKSQMALYSDLIYQGQANPGEWNFTQEGSQVAVGQVGMGVRVDDIATNFTQGGFESTNSVTDLAINGKGYFAVQDETGNQYYTRAGDFNVDVNGVMRNPAGLALMGVPLYSEEGTNSENQAETTSENNSELTTHSFAPSSLAPVNMDSFKSVKSHPTTKVSITDTNVLPDNCAVDNAENPYFGLLEAYDNGNLASSDYSNAQTMTLYDSEGNAHPVTIYYDGTPSSVDSRSVQFLVAEAVETVEHTGDGLLMSGVLSFDAKGELSSLSAYTPTVSGSKDLSDWQPASLSDDGLPQMNLADSAIALDFGLSNNSGWSNDGTAADVGTNAKALANFTGEARNHAVTGYSGTSFSSASSQDGYGEGVLSAYQIGTDGVVTGTFSNGENIDLWQIPLARFTSEYGLQRMGDNVFSQTQDAGQMTLGQPGTENFGDVVSYYIEQSNVDVSREMVSMIITQRGFQSNSKVVTTSDELLRTAINLKR